MNNYHYIVAGLPDITPDWRPGEGGMADIRQEILDSCSAKDRELIDFLEKGLSGKGLSGEGLDADFYRIALSHRNRFIREYFSYDLNVRNAKVKYLNDALGRDAVRDIVILNEDADTDSFEDAGKLSAILHGTDILERERGIDSMMWSKIDDITVFDYFDIETILGFLAKLHIVERWFTLDEVTGREMFRRLVDEVRGTFKGVNYNPDKSDKN